MSSIITVDKKYLQNFVKTQIQAKKSSLLHEEAATALGFIQKPFFPEAPEAEARKTLEEKLQDAKKDFLSLEAGVRYVLINSFGKSNFDSIAKSLEQVPEPDSESSFVLQPNKKLLDLHAKLENLKISPINGEKKNIKNILIGITIFKYSFPDKFSSLKILDGKKYLYRPDDDNLPLYSAYFYKKVLGKNYQGDMSQAILKLLNLRNIKHEEKRNLKDFYESFYQSLTPRILEKYLVYKFLSDRKKRADITEFISWTIFGVAFLNPVIGAGLTGVAARAGGGLVLKTLGFAADILIFAAVAAVLDTVFRGSSDFRLQYISPKEIFSKIESQIQDFKNTKNIKILKNIDDNFFRLNQIIVRDWKETFENSNLAQEKPTNISVNRYNFYQSELSKNDPLGFYSSRLKEYKGYFENSNELKRQINANLLYESLIKEQFDDEYSTSSERFQINKSIAKILGSTGSLQEIGRAIGEFEYQVYPIKRSKLNRRQLKQNVVYLWQRGANIKSSSFAARKKTQDEKDFQKRLQNQPGTQPWYITNPGQDAPRKISLNLDKLMDNARGWLGLAKLDLGLFSNKKRDQILFLGFIKFGSNAVPVYFEAGTAVGQQGEGLARALKYGTIGPKNKHFPVNYPEKVDLSEYIGLINAKITDINDLIKSPEFRKVKRSKTSFDKKFFRKYNNFLKNYKTMLTKLKEALENMNNFENLTNKNTAKNELINSQHIFSSFNQWSAIVRQIL